METVAETPLDVVKPTDPVEDAGVTGRWRAKFRSLIQSSGWVTALIIGVYTLGGFYITSRLWIEIDSRVTANNMADFAFFEFAFANAAHAVLGWDNPLFAANLNAPLGVNMMANTSMLGLTIPLAPVTLLWGTKPAIALATVIALAATATAWYFFFLRHITAHRAVAFVAAGFIGFAPGMVSQSNAHPNLVAQFMVPLIVSRVLRLSEPAKTVRHGIVLGLMITYQVFINEEVLFYTAIVCAVLVTVVGLSRRQLLRENLGRYAGGLAIAAGIALTLVAYPLWFQFFGPQHYTGPFQWAAGFGTDVTAFTRYSSESLGGYSGFNPVAANVAEENAFYGWPLCLLFAGFGIAYWRNLVVRTALICGLVAGALSLGQGVIRNGQDTGIPAPWRLVAGLPLFDAIIVTRMAMLVAPAMAIVLVVAMEKLLPALRATPVGLRRPVFTFSACALVAALLPLFPTPLTGTSEYPAPKLFSDGSWREYVTGGTVVPVPPNPTGTDALRWLVASDMKAPIADGYFLGPTGPDNPLAGYGPPQRETGLLLLSVRDTGVVPYLGDAHRRQAIADLKAWHADVLVLDRRQRSFSELRRTVNQMLQLSGESRDDAWVWDVRALVARTS